MAALITAAKAQGIQVVPYFTVAHRRRDFLPDYWDPTYTPTGSFDVHRASFRTYIKNVIKDVVSRYDVAGINLDYIRTKGDWGSPPKDICECKECQAAYAAKFPGRTLLGDKATWGGLRWDSGALGVYLQQWQADDVRDIVQGVHDQCKAIEPGLVITIDGAAHPYADSEGREEAAWDAAGIVDYFFYMDYGQPNGAGVPDFDWYGGTVRPLFTNPNKSIMLMANAKKDGDGNWSSQDGAPFNRLVEYVQANWPGAVGVYDYSLLNVGQVNALSQGAFKLPASPSWQKD